MTLPGRSGAVAREGIPVNPCAWLISVGRFKALDRLRRARRESPLDDVPEPAEIELPESEDREGLEDDRLRLISPAAIRPWRQTRGGLNASRSVRTDDRRDCPGFSDHPPALGQRIVRAKSKIHDARIPYEIPTRMNACPAGCGAACHLSGFNEGYSATSGGSLTRPDISGEAIRLGRC